MKYIYLKNGVWFNSEVHSRCAFSVREKKKDKKKEFVVRARYHVSFLRLPATAFWLLFIKSRLNAISSTFKWTTTTTTTTTVSYVNEAPVDDNLPSSLNAAFNRSAFFADTFCPAANISKYILFTLYVSHKWFFSFSVNCKPRDTTI